MKDVYYHIKHLFIIIIILFIPFGKLLFSQELIPDNVKTIEDVFQLIEQESDYNIFYQNNQINVKQEIKLTSEKQSIDEILEQVLKGTGLTYKYVDNHIVIFPISQNSEQPDKHIVRGKVTDDSKSGIPGVYISIKGTEEGTVTDIEGKYIIEVDNPEQSLVFSYIGYITKTEPINGRSEINIIMQVDAEDIDEVVVIGYGIQKKSDITGSISTIDTDDITKISVPDISQAMQGLAAGVDVTQNTGAPGEGVAVRIRGLGSVTGESDPLYIVDGVPTKDAMNNLSVSDMFWILGFETKGANLIRSTL